MLSQVQYLRLWQQWHSRNDAISPISEVKAEVDSSDHLLTRVTLDDFLSEYSHDIERLKCTCLLKSVPISLSSENFNSQDAILKLFEVFQLERSNLRRDYENPYITLSNLVISICTALLKFKSTEADVSDANNETTVIEEEDEDEDESFPLSSGLSLKHSAVSLSMNRSNSRLISLGESTVDKPSIKRTLSDRCRNISGTPSDGIDSTSLRRTISRYFKF